MGGWADGGPTNDVEVFRPPGSSPACPSSPPPDLPVSVYGPSFSSPISCGGFDTNFTRTSQCHHLDNGRWSTSPPLPAALSFGAMVELMGQKTWMGGSPVGLTAVNTVYTMDGDRGWTTAPPMLTRRLGHCVVVFDNDVAIITGDEYCT